MPQVRILSLRPKRKRGSYAPFFPLGPVPGPVFAPQTESCFACGECFTPTKEKEGVLCPLFPFGSGSRTRVCSANRILFRLRRMFHSDQRERGGLMPPFSLWVRFPDPCLLRKPNLVSPAANVSLRPKRKRGSYAPFFPLGPVPGPVFAPQTESCFACGECSTPNKATERRPTLFFCFKRIVQHLDTCRLPGCNPVNTGLSAYLTLQPIYVTILP